MSIFRLISTLAVTVVLFGAATGAMAGTARATLAVSATILPSPCSTENRDPNCIPVKQTSETVTKSYTIAVPSSDPNVAPSTQVTEGTATVTTLTY